MLISSTEETIPRQGIVVDDLRLSSLVGCGKRRDEGGEHSLVSKWSFFIRRPTDTIHLRRLQLLVTISANTCGVCASKK